MSDLLSQVIEMSFFDQFIEECDEESLGFDPMLDMDDHSGNMMLESGSDNLIKESGEEATFDFNRDLNAVDLFSELDSQANKRFKSNSNNSVEYSPRTDPSICLSTSKFIENPDQTSHEADNNDITCFLKSLGFEKCSSFFLGKLSLTFFLTFSEFCKLE